MWWNGSRNSGGSWLPEDKKANIWHGRGNSGASWPPAFPSLVIRNMTDGLKCLLVWCIRLFDTKTNNKEYYMAVILQLNWFQSKIYLIKSFFNEIDIYYSVRKKTFKAIYQLSYFLRHPVTNHWQKIKGQRCWWEGGGQEDFLHLSAVKQNGWTWITIKVIYISRINNNMFFLN